MKYSTQVQTTLKLKTVLSIAILGLSFAGCTSNNAKTDAATGKATQGVDGSWASRMRGMAGGLEELMPYVFSRTEFNDSENRSRIRKLIVDFDHSVELVPKHAGEEMLGKDPLVKFTIERLRSNTQHAIKAFDENHVEFSRNILRENMGLCFTCHTTTQFGPENNFSNKIISSNFRIQPTERAEYYVATRQFDRAIDVLEGVLQTPANLLDDPHEQVGALRRYLSLQVRVKKDAAGAASLIEKFLNQKKLPYFIATDAEAWLRSLRDWQAQGNKMREPFKQSQDLLKKARQKQSLGGYQSAYVDYLRASAMLHESLRVATNGAQRAEIYQLLGSCYDTLTETGTWDLPEVYFEACVRSAPRSGIAQKCYKEFERAIVLGFSGSAGIFVPKEERERMSELKMLSGLKSSE